VLLSPPRRRVDSLMALICDFDDEADRGRR
jgi:hypothetical protein